MTSDMKTGRINNSAVAGPANRLESFGIYRLTCQSLKDFGNDSEISAVPRYPIVSHVTCHLSPPT
jgi:hypothetical protein